MKKFTFWSILILLIYICFEILCLSGIFALKKIKNITHTNIRIVPAKAHLPKHRLLLNDLVSNKENDYNLHPDWGWSIPKNYQDHTYHFNSAGIRSNKEYSTKALKDIIRIGAFGDSFTYCSFVKNDETWEHYLNNIDKSLEVINFGVGGYGLDQAFLRYKLLGKNYHSDIVLIGYMSENLNRHVNAYRPFYYPETGIPLTKPRFKLKENKLNLLPNPLRTVDDYRHLLNNPTEALSQIGANDYFYQNYPHRDGWDFIPSIQLFKILYYQYLTQIDPNRIFIDQTYNSSSEAYKITEKIFDDFYSEVLSDGAKPVIVLFPNRTTLRHYLSTNQKVYQLLINHFKKNNMIYIDTIEAFKMNLSEENIKEYYKSGHFTPEANKKVANHIYSKLEHLLK